MSNTWRSKLGNLYDRSEIERNETKSKAKLLELRRLPENRLCADCGSTDIGMVSVNLGVFLCDRCGSIHRGVGTHVTKPKGCTGIADLWAPDEIERMRQIGNAVAGDLYGGYDCCPPPGSSNTKWIKFVVDKYVNKRFAPARHDVDLLLAQNSIPEQSREPEEKAPAEENLISFENRDAPPPLSKPTRVPLEEDFFSFYGV